MVYLHTDDFRPAIVTDDANRVTIDSIHLPAGKSDGQIVQK